MGLKVVDPQVKVGTIAECVAKVRISPEQHPKVIGIEVDTEEIVLSAPCGGSCKGKGSIIYF